MADLDDFFAKKDRKKKTSKKFTTTEEVAKKLEDTAKKSEKLKKERVPDNEDGTEPIVEQDEWKEFEEEKKDYTGLKIGNLNINLGEESNSQNTDGVPTYCVDQSENGGENHQTELDKKSSGPWNKMESSTSGAAAEIVLAPASVSVEQESSVIVEKTPIITTTTTTTTTYRPPAFRNSQFSSNNKSSAGGNSTRLRGKFGAAPDIHNEEFFPTLSKSGETKKNRSEGGAFEVVQHNRASSSSSYRQHLMDQQNKGINNNNNHSAGPQLNLGNRFNTLSSNDS